MPKIINKKSVNNSFLAGTRQEVLFPWFALRESQLWAEGSSAA